MGTVWQLVSWGQNTYGVELDRAGHTTTAVGPILYIYGGRRGTHFYNDVLCYNTQSNLFVTGVPECPCKARAHHSATLINNHIWFIGGSDKDNVFNDVFFLDVATRTWHQVTMQDPQELLTRCAHAAQLHPRHKSTIVIMGGFGVPEFKSDPSKDYTTLNDVLLVHTDRGQVERVPVYGDPLPSPRAYHSMSFIGDKAYIFGGRLSQDLISDNDPTMFCCLDLLQQRWSYPMIDGTMSGKCPSTRSSHKTVVHYGRMIMYGGAVNQEGQDSKKGRLGDMHTLCVKASGKQLRWSTCDCPTPEEGLPKARSAHEMTIVGDMLYIMLGYAGSEQGQKRDMYTRDCWKLKLLPNPALTGGHNLAATSAVAAPGTSVMAAAVPGGACSAAAEAGRQQAASSKTATRVTEHSKSPVCGAHSGVANNAAAGSGTSMWRNAKRQRSGALAMQQPADAGRYKGQQHQQQPPGDTVSAEGQQQPQLQLQQPPYEQQQTVQPVAAQHSPARQFSTVDAHAAAAAAAVWAVRQGQFVAGNERCCPTSPGYSGAPLEFHRQQEIDHLREQLHWQSSKTSSLEGENRQLKQQLQELKQEKQQADQMVQQLQGDCMRHKLSAEQAVLRQQHEQEESQLLRQQVDVLKQQLLKADGDAEQLRRQAHNLSTEIAALQGQVVVAVKEKEQLQEQQKKQQDMLRVIEEKHGQERQTYQQTYTNLAASIDDYRHQLNKLNDDITEGKRRHEAEAGKLRNEAASRDLSLQDKVRQLLEVQQQLDNLREALGDERKKAERFQQLHGSAVQAAQELQQNLQSMTGDNAHLQTEHSKLQVEHDRLKSELDKKIMSDRTLKAAVQQMQGLQQTILSILE